MKTLTVSGLSLSLIVLTCLTCTGCNTNTDVAGPFYSPFREGGTLTDWADNAIDQGIGQRIHRNVAPYPDNRVVSRNEKLSAKELQKEGKVLSERVAGMVGGWGHIADTSDISFAQLQGLALDLPRFRGEPRFAEALAATMMLYPALRAEYYPITAGSQSDWGGKEKKKKVKKKNSRGKAGPQQ